MFALVTGASSGIGLMYARELARRGHDVMLVSNQQEQLEVVAHDIIADFKVKAYPYFLDLAAEGAANTLHDYCSAQGYVVDILVNNAGVFFFNQLTVVSQPRVELMLNLHVRTVTLMCKLFGEDMAKRGRGYILNMSSMSAWMAMPGISTYNATKAYILNFSRSFWYEMKPYGVGVTAICPGAVDTGLYGLSDYWRRIAVAIGVSMTPQKLVVKALNAMFRRRKQAVPGVINGPFIFIIKHLPDWAVFYIMKKINCFQK